MLEYDADRYPQNYHGDTTSKPVWQTVQQEFVDYALYRSGYVSLSELPELDVAAQVLLSGLLVMADWISSDSKLFPYMRLADPVLPDSKKRADAAWAKLEFNLPWEAGNHWMSGDLYKERFKLESPRPIQLAIKQLLNQVQTPGIVVIEAPMGEGKTEAALAAAEILADMTKRRGVFFALPTQATSDGIFPRMLDWISHLDSEDPQSVRLVHGKAHHNETFRNLAYASNIDVDGEIGAYVHEWFTGRKRAILDDFVAGTIDQLLMRLTDLFLSLPGIPLILLTVYLFREPVTRALGPETGIFVIVVTVIGGLAWMSTARIVRATFLSLKQKEFVEAATALGISRWAIMFKHILPNAFSPIIVAATLEVGSAIITESSLSFLGVGFPPDTPTWGRLVTDGSQFLQVAPWLALFPGALIFLTVLSINFLGDGLRDALDPRSRL